MNMKEFGLITIFILLIAIIVYQGIHYQKSSVQGKEFKLILKTNIESTDNSLNNEQPALNFYSEASTAYGNGDYLSVQANCRLARSDFSAASNGYLAIASELKSGNTPLLQKYEELYTLASDIQTNLYEACEHFETAAGYYHTYYDTSVSADDQSYQMGTNEITAMNEKIADHDANVRKYNTLLADINTELEKETQ